MDSALQRKKNFYTRQRKNADQGAKEGDLNAQKTAAKIYGKLGKQVPAGETAGSGTPGPNEDAQRAAVFDAVSGGAGLVGGLARAGMGAAEKIGGSIARDTIPDAAESAARQTARRSLSSSPRARVIGKASMRDVTPAQKALKPGQKALTSGKSDVAAKTAPKAAKASKPMPDAQRKVNPRAAGTNMRAMGKSPRQIAAKRAAEEKAAAEKPEKPATPPRKKSALGDKIKKKVTPAAKKS